MEGGCVGKILVGVDVPAGVAVKDEVGVKVKVGVESGVEVATEVAVRLGCGVTDGNNVGGLFCSPQAVRTMQIVIEIRNVFFI